MVVMDGPLEALLGYLAVAPNTSMADRMEALRSAVREFCMESLVWRETVALARIEDGQNDVAAGAHLWRLPQHEHRALLTVLDVPGLMRVDWSRTVRASDGTPCVAAWCGGVEPLRARVAWVAMRGHEHDIPAAIFDAWGWDMSRGALAQLMHDAEGRREFLLGAQRARAMADGADGLNQYVL